jgi:hypothetical protein
MLIYWKHCSEIPHNFTAQISMKPFTKLESTNINETGFLHKKKIANAKYCQFSTTLCPLKN